jgi:hypothetical protein
MKDLNELIAGYKNNNNFQHVNETERIEANLMLKGSASTCSKKSADHFEALGCNVKEEEDGEYIPVFIIELPLNHFD